MLSQRLDRLPPYVFSVVDGFKKKAQASGQIITDFAMGNPDGATAPHIVETLTNAAHEPSRHRYSMSRGTANLRETICGWYERKFDVVLDPETEAIVTLGSKEGLAHLAMAMVDQGDWVLAPDPCYPIHRFGFLMAGAEVYPVPLVDIPSFKANIHKAIADCPQKPKVLVLNFPSNPTTHCVDLAFFEEMVVLAKQHNFFLVHDFAYAELGLDGYEPPSILQVPGAKEVAVESYSLSKSYNMPGWRVGFMCGNADIIAGLARIKSYVDYGLFAPVEQAAIAALVGPQEGVESIRSLYESRRNTLCDGLCALGWEVEKPQASMFVWAKIPPRYQAMGSLAFTKFLIDETGVAVSPGGCFGETGDLYVRFALIVEDERVEQALEKIALAFKKEIADINRDKEIIL